MAKNPQCRLGTVILCHLAGVAGLALALVKSEFILALSFYVIASVAASLVVLIAPAQSEAPDEFTPDC